MGAVWQTAKQRARPQAGQKPTDGPLLQTVIYFMTTCLLRSGHASLQARFANFNDCMIVAATDANFPTLVAFLSVWIYWDLVSGPI